MAAALLASQAPWMNECLMKWKYHRLFRRCTIFGRQRVREEDRRGDCDDVILVSPLVMRPRQRNIWTEETRHALRSAVNFIESLFDVRDSNYEVLVFGRAGFFEMIITGSFEMIVEVLTTCQTECTWDRSICFFFLFNRTPLQVFVTYLRGALYVHPLWFYKHQHDNRVRAKLFVACQRW